MEQFRIIKPRNILIENGTPVILRVTEHIFFRSETENGIIPAVVDSDVCSSDGSTVLIKAGTPATLEYSAESNGHWGKAGKVIINYAATTTIDGKRVPLRLFMSRTGRSKIVGVLILSIIFCPWGLFSGYMKGRMPEIASGTTFYSTVSQDVLCLNYSQS